MLQRKLVRPVPQVGSQAQSGRRKASFLSVCAGRPLRHSADILLVPHGRGGRPGGGPGSKLCPSAQPGMDRAMVLGVVQQDGRRPVVEYLNARLLATPEVLAMSAPLKPTEVFRLAATCAEHKCPHFDGADCRLATRVAKMLPPVVDGLPAVRHPKGMPVVFPGGPGGLHALSADHDRQLRLVAASPRGVRTARHRGAALVTTAGAER